MLARNPYDDDALVQQTDATDDSFAHVSIVPTDTAVELEDLHAQARPLPGRRGILYALCVTITLALGVALSTQSLSQSLPMPPLSNGCEPTIVIMGMARSGTSAMRTALTAFSCVDPGHEVEFWHITNESESQVNYRSSCGSSSVFTCQVHRVASAPWLFSDAPTRLVSMHHMLPRSLFILILRDPVSRFISSFFHRRSDREREVDLASLGVWANASDYLSQLPPLLRHTLLGPHSGYYTVQVELALTNVRAAIATDKLIVGLTEESDDLLARVRDALGLSISGQHLHGKMKGTGGDGHVNSDVKDFAKWGRMLAVVIAAVTQYARSYTNATSLSGQLRMTRDFPSCFTSQRLRCLWARTFDEPVEVCRTTTAACTSTSK